MLGAEDVKKYISETPQVETQTQEVNPGNNTVINNALLHSQIGQQLGLASLEYGKYTHEIDNIIDWAKANGAKTMEDTFVQNCIDHASFLVNVQNSDLPPRVPHIDNISIGRFASGIFLNTPEECAGGTAFYKYHGEISVDMSNPDIKLKNYNYYVIGVDSIKELKKIINYKVKNNYDYNLDLIYSKKIIDPRNWR
jgi:hypothetical protein